MLRRTALVQAGNDANKEVSEMTPPPYITSTYVQQKPGISKYEYGRTDNPTFRSVEKAIVSIEKGAVDSVVVSSGTGAINLVVQLLSTGNGILCDTRVYSGTKRLLKEYCRKYRIKTVFIDFSDLKNIRDAIDSSTKLIWAESPTNPMLNSNDIKKLANLSEAMLCIDSTMATPLNLSPLKLGADIVVHSTTKYLSGHSDLIGGAVCSDNNKLISKVRWLRNALGLNPSAFDCWLLRRGLKTLDVRLRRQEKNASKIAEWLYAQEYVSKVLVPDKSINQMKGRTGMFSVVFDLGAQSIRKLLENLEIWKIAESYGGVESMVDYPWLMTQSNLTSKERQKSGIPDNLVRFSAGLEDFRDLISDILQAMQKCKGDVKCQI